jgi:NDP-sugar pyrophosphorylase family protein
MQRNASRQLLFDENNNLCGWKNSSTGEEKISRATSPIFPFAFSGIQVLNHQILHMPFTGKFSMIDVYLHFAKTQTIKAFDHTGNIFIDVGKPESLQQAAFLFQ